MTLNLHKVLKTEAKTCKLFYDIFTLSCFVNKFSYSGDYISLMVRNYAMALPYGTKYIYETLPKMISLWLDFADNVSKFEDTPPYPKEVIPEISLNRKENLTKINEFLLKFVDRVPAFVVCIFFFCALKFVSNVTVLYGNASAHVSNWY